MSNRKTPLIINIILLTAILCFTNISMAADPVELENLRDSFTIAKQSVINEDQRKEVINNYIDSLTDLATDLRIYKHDLAGANMVRKEIRKAKKELDADPADRVEPHRQVIAATPEPKPVVATPVPKPEPMLAPAPKQVVAKPTPKPVMPIPAPKPAETKPKPKPIARTKPAPKPVVVTPVPKLFIPVPVPKPVIAKLKPKSVVAKPKPKPVVAKSKPKPVAKKKPAPKPVVAKPTPKPVPAPVVNPAPKKEHTPQTHVNSVQGLAGDGSSKNNVYTFNLPGIGSSTTLAFWATGRNSVETYGKVWLITPENRRIFIRIWKESYFEYPSTVIATYYKLRPITEDITKKVTNPGIYKVEFEWTEGKDPLVIYRVEITS